MADKKNKKKLLGNILESLGYTPQYDIPKPSQSMYSPYDKGNSAWRNRSEFIDYYWEPKVWDERTNPDAIPKKSNQTRTGKSDNGPSTMNAKTVDYVSLIPILTKAIQEQQVQILKLEEQIKILSSK